MKTRHGEVKDLVIMLCVFQILVFLASYLMSLIQHGGIGPMFYWCLGGFLLFDFIFIIPPYVSLIIKIKKKKKLESDNLGNR